MDTQERHDLKENDLAEFFANFGDWWNKHGTKLLVVLVVLATIVVGFRLTTHYSSQRHEAAWGDLAGATSPESLISVAEAHRVEAVRILAYLRAGDLYRERARETRAATAPAEGTPTAAEDLNHAKQAYQNALTASRQPIYRANALLGLAAVAESQEQWTEAANYYEEAAQAAGDLYPAIAAQANHRRDLLPDLQRPIAFGADRPDALRGLDSFNFDLGSTPSFLDMPGSLTPGPLAPGTLRTLDEINRELLGDDAGEADPNAVPATQDDAATDDGAQADEVENTAPAVADEP